MTENEFVVSRGPRPTFFADPSSDVLMSLVLALAQEVAVNRVRISRLQAALAESGIEVPIASIAGDDAELGELLERVLGPIRAFRHDDEAGTFPVAFGEWMANPSRFLPHT